MTNTIEHPFQRRAAYESSGSCGTGGALAAPEPATGPRTTPLPAGPGAAPPVGWDRPAGHRCRLPNSPAGTSATKPPGLLTAQLSACHRALRRPGKQLPARGRGLCRCTCLRLILISAKAFTPPHTSQLRSLTWYSTNSLVFIF